YNYVYSFPECKADFEQITSDEGNTSIYSCNRITKEGFDAYKHKCKKIFGYFNYLEGKGTSSSVPACCKYLNYWLYDELINNKESIYNTLSLFESFLDTYENDYNPGSEVCKRYMEDINDNKYKQVNNLFDLYNLFNQFEDPSILFTSDHCDKAKQSADKYNTLLNECQNVINQDYCETLDKFRIQYNQRVKLVNTCEQVPKYLPSYKSNNMAVTILIPIIITLAISFILFFLHKYTTFPSQLFLKIKKNARIFDYQYENAENILPISQSFNRNSEKGAWNMAYHTGTW
ncbi:PIR Superfamily Protein, partial [Plasmodium ovale curtisi]